MSIRLTPDEGKISVSQLKKGTFIDWIRWFVNYNKITQTTLLTFHDKPYYVTIRTLNKSHEKQKKNQIC